MGDEVWRFVRDLEALAVRSGKRVVELRVSGRGAARDVTVTFEKIEVSVDGVERDRAARTIGTALVRRWAARRQVTAARALAQAQDAEPLEFDAAVNEQAQMIALANNAISKVAANNTAIAEQMRQNVINAQKLLAASHEKFQKAISATAAEGGKDLIKLFNSHADFQMKFFAMVQNGKPNA